MSNHDTFIQQLKELDAIVFDERKVTCNSGKIYGVIEEAGSIKHTARKLNERNYDMVLFTYTRGVLIGGSKSQSLRLRDPSWMLPKYKRGVSITLFHKEAEAMSKDVQAGDILIVHDVHVARRPEFMQLTTNKYTKSSTWCYLDAKSLKPRITPRMIFQLTGNDIAVAKILNDWWMSLSTPAATTRYDPVFKTTEEMDIKQFCGYIGKDYIIMFIKVVASQLQKDNLLQLILTDFTPNKLPMARHYQSDDMIPSELLIQASLWDENATACLGIENGDYIELHNAQIKLSKLGYMELAVNGDRTSGKKEPKVKKISNIYNNPKVKHILQREEAFWKKVEQPSVLKKDNIDREDVHTVVDGSDSISTVEQILSDNHIEKDYTVYAAVLDVKPRDLQSWIKKWCPTCEWIEELDANHCSQCHQSINEYSLMSALLLQDSHGRRLQLQVYGEESKAMFPNLIPIRPEEDYVFALKDVIDRILSMNPEKPELYLNIGVKSYMALANSRQFRLRDTVFHFD
ncbi:hypothetical protein LRAMOSA07445 [Lichtheimia ramosa]|uniref:Protection of telomeres protein 1 ssDNA-binding domain-containing protein n=1 Tax=Lichtheimia ramosa TaxID=688394 RepID=A0A077WBS4_9FUNG|nr:hypothetical protein LRAMOSA07445 [Lichtheimia ramosa]